MIFKFAGVGNFIGCVFQFGPLMRDFSRSSGPAPGGELETSAIGQPHSSWSDHSIIPTLQNAAAICKVQWYRRLGKIV